MCWDACALVDPEAYVSLMSPYTARRTGLEGEAVDLSSEQPAEFQVAGGTTIMFDRSITASWRKVDGRQTFQTTFYVSPIPENVDMILGRDWSEKHRYVRYTKHILIVHMKKKGLYS